MDLQCPICLHTLTAPVRLPCCQKHMCMECMRLTLEKACSGCPLCRKRLIGAARRKLAVDEGVEEAARRRRRRRRRRSGGSGSDSGSGAGSGAGSGSGSGSGSDSDERGRRRRVLSAAGELRREWEALLARHRAKVEAAQREEEEQTRAFLEADSEFRELQRREAQEAEDARLAARLSGGGGSASGPVSVSGPVSGAGSGSGSGAGASEAGAAAGSSQPEGGSSQPEGGGSQPGGGSSQPEGSQPNDDEDQLARDAALARQLTEQDAAARRAKRDRAQLERDAAMARRLAGPPLKAASAKRARRSGGASGATAFERLLHGAPPPPRRPLDSWTCPKCTYENGSAWPRCAICDTLK